MGLLRRLHRSGHTCPWWFAYTFDNPLRGAVHRPAEILGGLVRRGNTVVDIGSGLGFFTLAMAEMVGPEGKVVAVDLQDEMLKRSRRRAERRGLADRIEFRRASHQGLGLSAPADFVLAFWMVHEVRDRPGFLAEVRSILRPTGHLLIAEPKGHVSHALFERITDLVREAGFDVKENRGVRFSRSILCVPTAEPA
jgi:ubiquinone/menaquinone biosynthesis C-methylase UbiE